MILKIWPIGHMALRATSAFKHSRWPQTQPWLGSLMFQTRQSFVEAKKLDRTHEDKSEARSWPHASKPLNNTPHDSSPELSIARGRQLPPSVKHLSSNEQCHRKDLGCAWIVMNDMTMVINVRTPLAQFYFCKMWNLMLPRWLLSRLIWMTTRRLMSTQLPSMPWLETPPQNPSSCKVPWLQLPSGS